jgi:hypothetical protein
LVQAAESLIIAETLSLMKMPLAIGVSV